MRILFITDYPPYPHISGDRIPVCNLIRRLAKEHEVSLAIALWTPDEAESISYLRDFCHRVKNGQYSLATLFIESARVAAPWSGKQTIGTQALVF